MASLLIWKFKNQYNILVLLILLNSNNVVSSQCFFDFIHKILWVEENNALAVIDVPIPRESEVCPMKYDPKHHLENFGNECPSPKLKELVIQNEESNIQLPDNNKNVSSWQNIVEQFQKSFSFMTAVVVIFTIPIIISIILIVSHRLYLKEVHVLMSNFDDVITKLNEQRDAISVISSNSDNREIETPKTDFSIEKLKDTKFSLENIFRHLQKLTNKLKDSHNQEVERYLTTEFLQMLAEFFFKKDTPTFDNLRSLTPENLLQLGKYRDQYKPMAGGDSRSNTRVNVLVLLDEPAPNISIIEETDTQETSEL